MAFEQNPMLQQFANPGMNQFQGPQMGFGKVQQPKKNFWNHVGEFFMGSKPQQLYSSPFNQNQAQGLMQLLQQGMGNMQNPYEGFEPLAQESTRNFNEQIVPGLAERFTQTGAAASSPAFASQLGGAGAGLQSMLNAQKAQYGMANKQFGLSQAQTGLTPMYENAFLPGSQGFFSKINQQGQQLAPLLLKLGMMG